MAANLLSSQLSKLAATDKSAELLKAQWDFDCRLTSQALSSVANIFPHFSRHDASHSETIVLQIERILGEERIATLSPTDIWLILEAAYWHDMGMVVTDEQARKECQESSFRNRLQEALENPNDPIHREAEILDRFPRKEEVDHSWPLDVRRAIVIALADYYRPQHAELSRHLVRDPSRIGLESPRTSLIPRRLFSLLGEICAFHGRDFHRLFDLPYCESGIGNDKAHPRFVAAMLRLGDLLDLDSDRFCPVMLAAFGPLPSLSEDHFQKHMSITHLRVDEKWIEVEALCETYGGYTATQQWLRWLDEEIRNQHSIWPDIVPSGNFGVLPACKSPRVGIRNKELLDQGKQPRFELSAEKVKGLLEGGNLYESNLSALRELLQNAVDATYLRIFQESQADKGRRVYGGEGDSELTPKVAKEGLSRLPIKVRFCRPSSPDGQDWTVVIEDAGIGMDLHDLRALASIGGGKESPIRKSLYRAMPEWLKPSGYFGLGFKSVYMLTDEVKITTCKLGQEKTLVVRLRKPTGAGRGEIIIEEDESGGLERAGTRIEFNVDWERNPKSFSIAGHDVELNQALKNWDPMRDSSLTPDYLKARRIVQQFSVGCSIPIQLEEEYCYDKGQEPSLTGLARADSIYDSERGLVLSVTPAHPLGDTRAMLALQYRGQHLENPKSYMPRLTIQCNLLNANAGQWLKINRESLLPTREKNLWRLIEDSIVANHTALLDLLPKEKRAALALALYVSLEVEELQVSPLDCFVTEKETLRDLREFDTISIIKWDHSRSTRYNPRIVSQEAGRIEIDLGRDPEWFGILQAGLSDSHPYTTTISMNYEEQDGTGIPGLQDNSALKIVRELTKTKAQQSITAEALIFAIKESVRYTNDADTVTRWIPAFHEDFEPLILDTGKLPLYTRPVHHALIGSANGPILLPFKFTKESVFWSDHELPAILDWLQENTIGSHSREEKARALKALLEFFQEQCQVDTVLQSLFKIDFPTKIRQLEAYI